MGDVGCSYSRFADCVRERHEHAVRPRRIASKRTRDSRSAGSNTLAACQADVDRKSRSRGIRSGRWSSSSVLERRYADARPGCAAGRVRIAVLDSIYNRRARTRVHCRHNSGRDARFRSRSGANQCSQQRSRDDEGRRARQQQSVGQHYHAASRDRTDRTDRRTVDCGNTRDQFDQKSASARLRLRRERDL